MRKILLAACIVFSSSCYAQNDAKVFFFRNDPVFPLFGHVTSYGVSLDGKEVHRVSPNACYVSRTSNTFETWHIKLPWFDWPSNKVDFTTATTVGTITLVAIRQNMFTPSKKALKKISLARFEKIYNRNRSLRDKMAEAGYRTVADLVSGYKVIE